MDLFKVAERMMGMDDAVWRRHANPWSVWTRFSVLPLICLAIWSRDWIGWGAIAAVAAALIWNWVNPRLFGEPARFESWASKGVLGERIFLNHRDEVSASHRQMALILSFASLPGLLIMVWGLIVLWWEGAVFELFLTILPKVWFVDRMVWIFEDWRGDGRPVPGIAAAEL